MTSGPGTHEGMHDGLLAALAANSESSQTPHVVIALPSYAVGESLLAHYGDRLMALEHRYLLSLLQTHRLPGVEVVCVCSVAPSPAVLDYYRSLGPDSAGFAARAHAISLDDPTPRSVAQKLLDRPDLLQHIREIVGDRPAMVEPWNVTEDEMGVAARLGLPVNGMTPALRRVGFKSEGRRLFRDAGVPVPRGVENVRSTDDVIEAIQMLQALPDGPAAAVIKHDDSGAGDGNTVLALRDADHEPVPAGVLGARLAALPAWYLADLRLGGIVEEFLTGVRVSSPSAQVDLLPDGRTAVIATHEQELGGENGQVFLGCRFPADPAYAAEIAAHASAIARRLVRLGVVGRASIDFMAVDDGRDRCRTYALEVNLRKGGTTHSYSALRNLVPGRYDAAQGRWIAANDERPRAYVCTDNCVDPAWQGLEPRQVIEAVDAAGLGFDHRRGVGTVLHMLDGLAIDGRFGAVAIGEDPAQAAAIFRGVRQAVAALALPG